VIARVFFLSAFWWLVLVVLGRSIAHWNRNPHTRAFIMHLSGCWQVCSNLTHQHHTYTGFGESIMDELCHSPYGYSLTNTHRHLNPSNSFRGYRLDKALTTMRQRCRLRCMGVTSMHIRKINQNTLREGEEVSSKAHRLRATVSSFRVARRHMG
jgi:hypothetical protein